MSEPQLQPSYDASFFEGNRRFADRSARAVVRLLLRALPIESVVDFGCAEGAWLQAWRAAGVSDVTGLDGEYVEPSRLLVPVERFQACDLAKPIDLGRRFDLCQSLEVAEHLPAIAAPEFVGTLTRHAPLVLFSAAPPGQGGYRHINEQPYDYWRDLFAGRGYALFDWIRPQLAGRKSLAPWYRFNTFLFADAAYAGRLPAEIARTRISDDAAVADVSPLDYKLRKAVVRKLSQPVQNYVSQIKRRAAALR